MSWHFKKIIVIEIIHKGLVKWLSGWKVLAMQAWWPGPWSPQEERGNHRVVLKPPDAHYCTHGTPPTDMTTYTHMHTQTWLHDCIHTHAHTHMTTYTCHTCTHTMCIHPYDNNDNNNNKYLKWIHGNYKIIDYFKRVEKLMNSCGFLVSPFRCLFLLDKAPAHSSTRLKIYTKLVL